MTTTPMRRAPKVQRLPAYLFTVAIAVAFASPVHADAIVSFGQTIPTQVRPTLGLSWGTFVSPFVGWELEFATTRGKGGSGRLSMGTFGASFLVQVPTRQDRLNAYGAFGFGLFGGSLPDGRASGEVGYQNVGGGIKFQVAGPLLIRVDYRLFRLGEAPDANPPLYEHTHVQRALVGFGVAF